MDKLKLNQNIVIENLNENINEELLYSIYNFVDIEDKYLVVTSDTPISKINFKLQDLKSRCNNFIISKIDDPDDESCYACHIDHVEEQNHWPSSCFAFYRVYTYKMVEVVYATLGLVVVCDNGWFLVFSFDFFVMVKCGDHNDSSISFGHKGH